MNAPESIDVVADNQKEHPEIAGQDSTCTEAADIDSAAALYARFHQLFPAVRARKTLLPTEGL